MTFVQTDGIGEDGTMTEQRAVRIETIIDQDRGTDIEIRIIEHQQTTVTLGYHLARRMADMSTSAIPHDTQSIDDDVLRPTILAVRRDAPRAVTLVVIHIDHV